MIVIVCPGQGSQTPGFLTPWVERPEYRQQLEAISDAAGLDLLAHGTVSDADTIRDTAVAQPLIVAAGLLALGGLLRGASRDRIGGVAGHSVGEITAAAAAGVLSEADAMDFVTTRGRAMADAAAAATATGMSAVLGGQQDAVLAALEQHGLFPANYNGGGQLVVAGPLEGLAALKDEPPAGSRVIPLQVAGAFHTHYMAPAQAALQALVPALGINHPGLTLWSNRDGSAVSDGAAFVELMVGQVASPVRWDLCMDSFAAAGVSGIIELAPGGTLTGLAKRALKGIPGVAVKTPDDLAAAIELLEAQ